MIKWCQFESEHMAMDFMHTVNIIWTEVPNRALTISKNVRAPFAFSFTFAAITEKKIIWILLELSTD